MLLASLYGAMSMARAAAESPLSREVPRTARETLPTAAGKEKRSPAVRSTRRREYLKKAAT